MNFSDLHMDNVLQLQSPGSCSLRLPFLGQFRAAPSASNCHSLSRSSPPSGGGGGESPNYLTSPAPSSTEPLEDFLKQSLCGPFPDQTPWMHSIVLQMKNKTPSGFLSLKIGLSLQPNWVTRGSMVQPCIWVTQLAPQPTEPSSLFWNPSPSCGLRQDPRQVIEPSLGLSCFICKWHGL